ncbi:MAG TPA: phosphatidate cytidylyltransferase, partial [Micropepsaceae bacterium]|nr:phosphatidate cytidylyltransferase [Micropepsaceae bacterium]
MTDTQPSMPARFELPARTASGLVMGLAAVTALLSGGVFFAAFVLLGAVAALGEWHRLVNGGHLAPEMLPTGLSVVAAVWLLQGPNGLVWALVAVLLGGCGAALLSVMRRFRTGWMIPWHAFGALYVGVPVLAIVFLREAPHGAVIVGALFVAVWTADTGALLFGRVIGGPKLAPVLSPNKTWAGFLGGTIAAAIGEGLYVAILGGNVPDALALGIFLALAGHSGDLFESWVKRQFRAKN